MADALNIKTNDPLNFRHSNTLITTKVPHYPTKLTTGVSIIPGWNRPNANGQNSNINDKDYNGPNFKPRPLKQWRKQLRIYNNRNGATSNSRSVTISQLQRPGLTVYHFNPDCTCVDGEAGNSYIISENKFGYETKGDNYSKLIDVGIQNNGYSIVPYNATPAELNDPTNSAYKVYTGIYNTNCINCSPEGNQIKSGVAFQSQAFYSYNNQKLQNRCKLYEQNISTNKALGCNYFSPDGIPLWPNDEPNGPQVFAPVDYGSTVYKGNFFNIYQYGYSNLAVGSFSFINSADFTPKVKCNPKYVIAGFYVNVSPASLIEATIYDSTNLVICKSINTQYSYINTNAPFAPSSFNIASRIFYFSETVFIEPSKTYYIVFRTINSINFNWLVENYTTNILSGTLVAEPLYCLSQTIYKPNNVGFAKQGAVAGATRIKKLVSDTVCMNGSSFYSAKGAEEANLGKYQGTNISSNYYVKNKPVVNSCYGNVPSAPFLFQINLDLNSITVSWYVNSNGGCNILYYTLTYIPLILTRSLTMNSFIENDNGNDKNIENNQIQEDDQFSFINTNSNENYELSFQPRTTSNPTQIIIYPSSSNIYTIDGLSSNTEYNIIITATNNNGTSLVSNIIKVKTLGSVEITVTPNNYTYTYNSTTFPIIATVTLSNLNIYTPINCSLINLSNVNVASLTNISLNTYTLTISNSGSFNIYAEQAAGGGYNGSNATSPPFSIIPDTPVIFFNSSFNTTGTWGSDYTLIPASFSYPTLAPPGVSITYTSTNTSVATISGTTVTILTTGTFAVVATTNATQNYNSTTITSSTVIIKNKEASFLIQGELSSYFNITYFTADGVASLNPVENGKTVYTFADTGSNAGTTRTGTVTPNFSGLVEYLVIAGGGGGGNAVMLVNRYIRGGGGGAGGYRNSTIGEITGGGGPAETQLNVISTVPLTLTVGAGGGSSQNGTNSVFATIVATGGGYGGTGNTLPGDGGSGGGGSANNVITFINNIGKAVLPTQGYSGGPGNPNNNYSIGPNGGGGGGAGRVGSAVRDLNGGNGGNGLSSNINYTLTTRAGGGGGALNGNGGTGGGGSGSNGLIGNSGAPRTGSGGGGGGATPGGSDNGGSGGSGIVILRFNSF
jgi:hypothetical protein